MSGLSTSCEMVVFCSSAGHCQLDCDYCVVNPVIKRQPSIAYEDLRFFLEKVGKTVFFIFSGKGDFFAGYPKRDRFLDRLLDHEVEVALDINGVLLQEYPELSPEKLGRIRAINLTMHYKQIKDKKVQRVWVENAKTILRQHRGELILGTIMSPLVMEWWEEGLEFYRDAVFAETGQKIGLIEDCDRPYTPEQSALFSLLYERFADMVDRSYRQDFAGAFADHEYVLCPAGRDYFRIWNDGRVQGCPHIGELRDCGNLKERRLEIRETYFRCNSAKYCDCYDIKLLGKMRYEPAAVTVGLPVFPSI